MNLKRNVKNSKKSAIILCFATFLLFSCENSIDKIIDNYNGIFVNGSDAGDKEIDYIPGEYNLPSLLAEDEYNVKKGDLLELSVKEAYKTYDWDLTDGTKNYKINKGIYKVDISTGSLEMEQGSYTLTVTVTNSRGDTYRDVATIFVYY